MPMFCQFRVASAAGFRGGMPTLLRGGKGQPDVLPPLPTATFTRTVTVNQPSGGLNLDMTLMNLNNLRYSDPDIEMPKQGTVEIWNIVNTTVEPHPIHLHGLWSDLELGGGRLLRKHTITVKPGEKLSYLVRADATGRWAYHCHLLYHMEAGMFREVRVVDNATTKEARS